MDSNEHYKPEEKTLLNAQTIPTICKTLDKDVPQSRSNGRGKALRQVLASFVANLGTVNTGMAFGFPAVATPQMKSGVILQIDAAQETWIASLSSATTPIGCLLSGYLMDNIGRKVTLLLTEIPLILGWALVATASNVEMIYVGRMLIGFGSGMVGAPARVYTAEVSQPHLRGMLGALASVGVSFGVLIQYVIGSFVAWNILAAISMIIPILSLLLMIFMPETPNYLLTKKSEQKAMKSLVRLRGMSCNVDSEIGQMIAFKQKNKIEPLNGKALLKGILSPSALKPFAILAIYFFIYQWSGINTITFYLINILKRAIPNLTNETKRMATIGLGIVRLAFTVVGCIASRKYGRRPLTFISAIGCGSCMIGLGTYMYVLAGWEAANLPAQYIWFPLLCIFAHTVFCTIGFLIVPWVMIGEVYPTQVRGILGGMTTMIAHLSIFVVVKTFNIFVDLINESGIFWLYGVLSLCGLFFFYFFLPETKGRTLQEIEDYFCGRTKNLQPQKTPTSQTNGNKNHNKN